MKRQRTRPEPPRQRLEMYMRKMLLRGFQGSIPPSCRHFQGTAATMPRPKGPLTYGRSAPATTRYTSWRERPNRPVRRPTLSYPDYICAPRLEEVCIAQPKTFEKNMGNCRDLCIALFDSLMGAKHNEGQVRRAATNECQQVRGRTSWRPSRITPV